MRGVCRARCVFCAHDNWRVEAAYVQMRVYGVVNNAEKSFV